MRVSRPIAALALLPLVACVNAVQDEGAFMSAGLVDESAGDAALSRTCAEGETVRGIDVSYWQDTIDWDRVAGDNVQFAFIRVSDGTHRMDTQFQRNWAEAKRVGILRGTYQFFRPNQDPIEQANILLDRMGPLEPGDLPPVIDIEATGGQSRATIQARAQQWIDHVEQALGVTPIIYTGPYFWRDQVGAPSFAADHSLWVAHYTSGCALTPEPWSRWNFHQYTDSGSVNGVNGNTDMNTFNGSYQDLLALTVGEGSLLPPGCEPVGADGAILEEDGACARLVGPQQYFRTVDDAGHGGQYVWTGAIDGDRVFNSGRWTIAVESDGEYRVGAYVDGGAGASREATYVITHADGSTAVEVDQSAASGFVPLGTYRFTAEAAFEVRLDDATGENSSLSRRVVFDALEVVPNDVAPPPAEPEPAPSEPAPAPGEPEPEPQPEPEPVPDPTVCHALPASGGVIEEDSACATLGGPTQYLRAMSGGHGGGYVWTGTTDLTQTYNYAEWNVDVSASGRYLVEAYLPGGAGTARQARYHISHDDGASEVVIDQTRTGGFVRLGVFPFGATPNQKVRLDDNTGEDGNLGRRLAFDAVRLTPATDVSCAQVRVETGGGALNVRATPDTTQSVLFQLSDNEVVDRLDTVTGVDIYGNTDWHLIRRGDEVGFVSGFYAVCTD